RMVAKEHRMPFVDLDKGKMSPNVLERIPREVAEMHGLVPVVAKAGELVVAIDDPAKRIAAGELGFLLGTEVTCALATAGALKRALSRYYGAGGETAVA